MKIKLPFLILFALCAQLSLAADLPAEYDLMVEYRELYLQLQTSTDANVSDRMRLRRLERNLKSAGLTDEEFALVRKTGKREMVAVDIHALKQVERAINNYQVTGSTRHYRSEFFDQILSLGHIEGLEVLASMIPQIAENDFERFTLEHRLLKFLEGKNHSWSSTVRWTVISQIPRRTRGQVYRDSIYLDKWIVPIYAMGLNADEETNLPRMKAELERQAVNTRDARMLGLLTDALSKNPEYGSELLVRTLLERSPDFNRGSYLMQLFPLIRQLPPEVRQPMISALLHYYNRFEREIYFWNPVFNEDHFLELLSEELKTTRNAMHLRVMRAKIFSRPEFANRTDLGGLAPHVVIPNCDSTLGTTD